MSYASIGASEPGRNTPRTGVRPARNRADIPRDRRTRGYIVVPRITDPCRRGPAAHRCTAALARNQIGSESCRERVCQYVEISVVGVYLKKKIQQRHATRPHLANRTNTT